MEGSKRGENTGIKDMGMQAGLKGVREQDEQDGAERRREKGEDLILHDIQLVLIQFVETARTQHSTDARARVIYR